MNRKLILNFTSIAAGAFLLAAGINFFLAPAKISTGGVSGIGILVYYLSGIPISVTSLVLNTALLLLGLKSLTLKVILRTLLGIALSSLFLELLPVYGKAAGDAIISAVCGGVLVGAGIGLVVSRNASTGGSDFAAIMLKKLFPAIPLSYLIFFIDTSVIVASGIVFSDFVVAFYSVLALFISAKITDILLIRGDFAKTVMIISEKSNEISEKISRSLKRGTTGLYGRGMYLKENKTVVLCVLKPKEIPLLKELIREIDKNAFLIISDAREVLGEGFK